MSNLEQVKFGKVRGECILCIFDLSYYNVNTAVWWPDKLKFCVYLRFHDVFRNMNQNVSVIFINNSDKLLLKANDYEMVRCLIHLGIDPIEAIYVSV
jgi:hypothetical protein